MSPIEKFFDPHIISGNSADHRYSQFPLQLVRVYSDTFPTSFVDQVQIDHNLVADVQNLECQIEVSFETCCVNHHNSYIRPAEKYEVSSHFLIHTSSLKRVCSWQVNQLYPFFLMGERPLCTNNRFTRPVPSMLAQTGKSIEYRALANIRISGKSNQDVPFVWVQAKSNQALCPMLGATTT